MQRRNAFPRSAAPRAGGSGSGFTLIELLIVITVIAILIGLLVPAVMSVQRRVRDTAVQAEINRLASSVTAFKTTFGNDPPSYIVLCEKATDWASTTNPAIVRSRALIRQLWPQFDFTYASSSGQLDINNNGTFDGPTPLWGGECLVFFLGGLPQPTTSGGKSTFTLLAFTKNPQNPFTSAANANREKSAYDFPADRLMDSDSNGYPEFLDSYPGQKNCVLYFSSYDGNGYRLTDYPGNVVTVANPTPPDMKYPCSPYLQGTTETSPSFNAKSFQIISPGKDGEYGPGGPYIAGASTPLPAWKRTASTPNLNVALTDRLSFNGINGVGTERDNITNFGNGPLVP